MWRFIKTWSNGGTTIDPGVSISGKSDIVETDTTISVKGSEFLKDIPKDVLEEYSPTVYAIKSRIKVK